MIDLVNFFTRIKKFVKYTGKTFYQLAADTNLYKTSYITCNYLGRPPAKVIYAIGEFYPEVNLRWLLTGEGDMIYEPDLTVHNESNLKSRINEIVSFYGFKNKTQMCRELGFHANNFDSSILMNKITSGTLEKFVNNLDGLNIRWLLFGEGYIMQNG